MILKSIILILIGFFLLIKGAEWLVEGASNVARCLKIPDFIIGLTIVSIGTSMPELFISLTSAIEGFQDITIGNVIGSNIANLLLILGVAAIIKTVDIEKGTLLFEIPICLLTTLLFTLMCVVGNDITRLESSILIMMFIAFISYTIAMTKKKINDENTQQGNENTSNDKQKHWLEDVLFIILGIASLKIGGDFSVNNATELAHFWGLSEKIISITILAIGTSLPELVTSVVAAVKGNSDIAVGNVLGSNLFNFLLIVGTAGLINPITYNTTYNIDMIILIVATALFFIFPFIPPKNKMSRFEGVIYVLLYAGYLVTSFYI